MTCTLVQIPDSKTCGEPHDRMVHSLAKRRPISNQGRLHASPFVQYWSRHEFERYDRVLLDAPCSNDRHIVQQVRYWASTMAAIYPTYVSRFGCLFFYFSVRLFVCSFVSYIAR